MISLGHNLGQNIACQVCKLPDTKDSQHHLLLDCQQTKSETATEAQYSELFTDNSDKLTLLVQEFDKSLQKRIELLENNNNKT